MRDIPTGESSSNTIRIFMAVALASLLAIVLLGGCSQNEPNASDATTESATPAGDKAEPPVAESSSVNDMADGIATVNATQKLKSLKSAADVRDYIEDLQEEIDDEADDFDRMDPDDVKDVNELISEIRDLNQYLHVLVSDNIITQSESDIFSIQIDQMLLTLDAMIAS